MKRLSLLLVALAFAMFSCKPEIEKPTVVTKSVGEVTETTAKVIGQVTADGGAEVTERGVCWSVDGTPTVLDYRVKDAEGGLGTFTSNLSDLEPNTTYYVRAYATNEAGTSYGEEKSLTTEEVKAPETPEDPNDPNEPNNPNDPNEPETPEQPEDPNGPVVATNEEVSDITVSSAVCGGEVISGGDAVVIARGVCWSTTKNPTVSDSYTTDGSGIGTYTSNISNLTDNTTYYVRAYATNASGATSYGGERVFTTLEKLLPTVITKEVKEIAACVATSRGEVTFDGNLEVTSRGVCWSASQNPTINDNKTEDGSGIGSFTSQLTNLEPNTTYYVRAYATNEKGVAYGEERSFKTVEITLPTVSTIEVTNIGTTSASCGGNVTSDGNGTVTERGVCWSTSPNPTINDNETNNGSGTGSYTSQLINLVSQTTYYVRAYAINEKGVAYGNEMSFTTLSKFYENGHEYVDLGLPSGLKWATCNVGADSPEGYGDYFAWGETETKEEYLISNSLTYGLAISELQSQGYIDSEGNLTASHDAATANWGGNWRMPTYYEMQELVDNCTWGWTTQNGVNGYKVTGPNGNNIFLPAAGYRYGSSLGYDGGYGDYWSSTPYYYDDNDAYNLHFYDGRKGVVSFSRRNGLPVRPITE